MLYKVQQLVTLQGNSPTKHNRLPTCCKNAKNKESFLNFRPRDTIIKNKVV